MTAPLPERLQPFAAWAVRFADPSFNLGAWVPSRTRADGVIQVGWYEMGEAGQQFVSEMYELGWVYDFDWMKWLGTPQGQQLTRGPEPIATASAADLAKVLTAIIRSERFGDGQLEGAFESGILVAIARRARELGPRD